MARCQSAHGWWEVSVVLPVSCVRQGWGILRRTRCWSFLLQMVRQALSMKEGSVLKSVNIMEERERGEPQMLGPSLEEQLVNGEQWQEAAMKSKTTGERDPLGPWWWRSGCTRKILRIRLWAWEKLSCINVRKQKNILILWLVCNTGNKTWKPREDDTFIVAGRGWTAEELWVRRASWKSQGGGGCPVMVGSQRRSRGLGSGHRDVSSAETLPGLRGCGSVGGASQLIGRAINVNGHSLGPIKMWASEPLPG